MLNYGIKEWISIRDKKWHGVFNDAKMIL
jgi:hypothetical protein